MSADGLPPRFDSPDFADESFTRALRLDMLKFARMQVRDEQLAEDAVQEAMFSAYRQIEKFGHRAAFKTWVFTILKNKLIDLLRKEKKFTLVSQLEKGNCEECDGMLDKLFDEHGHWHKHERPTHWQNADHEAENSHFWRVFDACLNGLPERYGRLFMMREFLELETAEICTNEAISVSHLNVTLYRARIRLRECLENHWYQMEAAS